MDKDVLNAYRTAAENEANYQYSEEVKAEHARIMALPEKERLDVYEDKFNDLFDRITALCATRNTTPYTDGSKTRELYVEESGSEIGVTLRVRAERTQDLNASYTQGCILITPLLYGITDGGCASLGKLESAPGVGSMDRESGYEKSLFNLLDHEETLRQVEGFIA